MHGVLANFWILVRGRGAAAIMAFAATALMARALGPVEFGMVVLIHTYAMLLRALLDFGTADAMVRYGVPALDDGNNKTLARLIRVCRRVDRRTSAMATVLALIIAPMAGPLMGMDPHHVTLLAAYSVVLITTGTGTSMGILRLYDRVDIIGRQMTIAPIVLFFGVVLAWWFESSLQVFIAIRAAAYAAENFYLMWHAKQKYNERLKPVLAGVEIKDVTLGDFNGLRHFLWVIYWQSNLDVLPKHTTSLLVGYLLGPAEAGMLRLAREISSLLAKPALLIRQVVFLDLTRSWNQGSDAFKVITYSTVALGGALGLVFVALSYFFGDVLLARLLGKDFAAAAPVLTLMLLAATFDLSASPLRSALYASGHAAKVLRFYVLSTFVYLALLVMLTSKLGLIGAGVAATAASLIPLIGMLILMYFKRPT